MLSDYFIALDNFSYFNFFNSFKLIHNTWKIFEYNLYEQALTYL